jgi:hypothetical protein
MPHSTALSIAVPLVARVGAGTDMPKGKLPSSHKQAWDTHKETISVDRILFTVWKLLLLNHTGLAQAFTC